MRGSTNSSTRRRLIDKTNGQMLPARAMKGSASISMRRRSIDRQNDEAFSIKMMRLSPNSSTRRTSIDNNDAVLPMKTMRGVDNKLMSTSDELTS